MNKSLTQRVLHWLAFLSGISLIILGIMTVVRGIDWLGFTLSISGIVIAFYYYIKNRPAIKKIDQYVTPPLADSPFDEKSASEIFTLKQWGYLGLLFVIVVVIGIIIVIKFY